ncbi:MAG TPA: hypothetical protein PLY00_16010 [Verrucomicrobiota bacterium]|jgi:hypothetical protein|nr:hypothetical protein [Verrucomicrobiota bacterium]OQC64603.1 MAG: hypothetical protein BWX48_02758 [Verrucomicrobia bacterium ADurb.Bin006]HOA62455.1 hypothetical protein [Verrucomicrobiota bacterium]HOF49724.1 hypothetical protein [Verrucomicrobiota bacterium]HOG88378.1 hypothetical protein [Verrucomicrobiota bacterium]
MKRHHLITVFVLFMTAWYALAQPASEDKLMTSARSAVVLA